MQTNVGQFLLIRASQPENTYGPFVGEILRAEGLSGFRPLDLDTDGLPEFSPGDLAVLTRCVLRYAEIDALVAALGEIG